MKARSGYPPPFHFWKKGQYTLFSGLIKVIESYWPVAKAVYNTFTDKNNMYEIIAKKATWKKKISNSDYNKFSST